VLVRYIYEGGKLSRDARLIDLQLQAKAPGKMPGCFAADLLAALVADGVSLERFFMCAFEIAESGGAWLPLLKSITSLPEGGLQGDQRGPYFPLPVYEPGDKRPRIDLKLERREPLGNRPGPIDTVTEGYFGVGIVGAKTGFNVGSLWRAAFQLGAQFIFTVGGRYEKTEAMDRISADARLPMYEYSNWADFAAHSPEGAVWIGVEMGGEPLETFEHPPRAVYLLGSEDTGLPASVAAVRAIEWLWFCQFAV
jgi:tRNA(Leu) C34 or U34 (ribose-2'-O)-methylase TrmL